MLKKFFLALGVAAVALVGSCVVMVSGSALVDAPKNKEVAINATRELARAWNVKDVRPLFTTAALRQINFDRAQTSVNAYKSLGPLKSITDASQTEFRFHKSIGQDTIRTATIVIEAAFENGLATVTVKLANDGPDMKVVHIHVQSQTPLTVRQDV